MAGLEAALIELRSVQRSPLPLVLWIVRSIVELMALRIELRHVVGKLGMGDWEFVPLVVPHCWVPWIFESLFVEKSFVLLPSSFLLHRLGVEIGFLVFGLHRETRVVGFPVGLGLCLIFTN